MTNNLKNIASTIRNRRTVKQFTEKNVDSDLIMKAIDLARWAPNHHLTEPWHFYILNDSIIKKCIELIRVIVTEKKGEEIGNFKAENSKLIPGWLVVTSKLSESKLTQQEDYASVCCAIQNLWLAARTEGIGLGWVSILSNDVLKKQLELPEHIIPVAYLCLGHVTNFEAKPDLERSGWLPRLDLKDVIYFEKWEQKEAESWNIIKKMIESNLK